METFEDKSRRGGTKTRYLFSGCIRKGDYSDEYYTPSHIVTSLGRFDLDPSAGPKSHARRNIRLPKDGLSAKWTGRVWMNPPYSTLHRWLQRFVAHGDGVALVNARPDAKWFQYLCAHADAILWLRGRVRFERPDGTSGGSPVGSVLVAYGERNAAALLASGLPGVVMTVRHCTPNAGAVPRRGSDVGTSPLLGLPGSGD